MANKNPKECSPDRPNCDHDIGLYTNPCGCYEWCAGCSRDKFYAQTHRLGCWVHQGYASVHGWNPLNGPDPKLARRVPEPEPPVQVEHTPFPGFER